MVYCQSRLNELVRYLKDCGLLFLFLLGFFHMYHAPLVQLVHGSGLVGMRVVHLCDYREIVRLILREAAALAMLRFLIDAVASGRNHRVVSVTRYAYARQTLVVLAS